MAIVVEGNTSSARIKCARFSAYGFRRLFEAGSSWRVVEGIPAGAKVAGIQVDPKDQLVYLFLEHESFPPMSEGEAFEDVVINFERVKGDL